ncbi:putative retrotransposon-like protein 1-like [Triplophysa rosa]|uniref:ribonuclease H n=1 Tax=Triplophysa rosa TaxID=992332 RepID=A0A9W7WY86_TRIRA|nr:putative retrotransposon-like protein 1-like [Triplophysa rosa]
MNPAEEAAPPSNVDRILSALAGQAAAIQRHDQPKLPAPERFDGSPEKCHGFITQCTLVFQLQPGSFPTENSKVAYMITLLTGRALTWASALWEQRSTLTADSGRFIDEMKKVFHHPASVGDVEYRLLQLSQGTRTLSRVPPEYEDLREVFSKSRATSLPQHRPYDCGIDLIPGAVPPRGRLYSLSDGDLRPCIDYRGLNHITIKNRYPLPLMTSAFEILQGATIFTKLDLRNAYHLVRIRRGDEWKTAFNTPTGHYEYRVMPFGLANAPAVFQALINDVLREMLDKFVFVYLDDILIFSASYQDHIQHVRQVLSQLLKHSLFVKLEKSEFHVPSVSFLGFIVSRGSLQMDPGKIRAVQEWPQPSSLKQVQRFLGGSIPAKHVGPCFLIGLILSSHTDRGPKMLNLTHFHGNLTGISQTGSTFHRSFQDPEKDKPSVLPATSPQIHEDSSYFSYLPTKTSCLFFPLFSSQTGTSCTHHQWATRVHCS